MGSDPNVLLLSNLSALIKGSADEEIKINDNPKNKFRYQSNRSFIVGQMKLLFPQMVFGLSLIKPSIEDIHFDACREKSQIQPDRKLKRKAKKDNKRTHFKNRNPSF